MTHNHGQRQRCPYETQQPPQTKSQDSCGGTPTTEHSLTPTGNTGFNAPEPLAVQMDHYASPSETTTKPNQTKVTAQNVHPLAKKYSMTKDATVSTDINKTLQ